MRAEVVELGPPSEAFDHRDTQAESFWRPLRRRFLMIDRPARSDIRCRKPCFLARRRLLGWYVRFTVSPVLCPWCRDWLRPHGCRGDQHRGHHRSQLGNGVQPVHAMRSTATGPTGPPPRTAAGSGCPEFTEWLASPVAGLSPASRGCGVIHNVWNGCGQTLLAQGRHSVVAQPATREDQR